MTDALKGIGIIIREIWRNKELSQQKLVESAGISYKYLGEIERGDGNLLRAESTAACHGAVSSDCGLRFFWGASLKWRNAGSFNRQPLFSIFGDRVHQDFSC
jgi:transcriptional regulator with XRE-family HTH domain